MITRRPPPRHRCLCQPRRWVGSLSRPSPTHAVRSAPSLAFTVEVSLPHLPGRSPFHNAAAPHLCHDRTAALLGQTSSSATTASWPLHVQWVEFVRLCDSLVRLTARTAAASPNDARPPPHRLAGVVVPCKQPYFSVGGPAATTAMSTTQAALWLLHRHWCVPATLAINTVHTAGSDTAATPARIDAVVRDAVQVQGCGRLLLLRGDTAPAMDATPHAPPSTLSTAAELVCHVSGWQVRQQQQQQRHAPSVAGAGAATLELCVAGYPQGHPLDRVWDTHTVDEEDRTATAASRRRRSHEFLRAFERDFNDAERAADAAVCVVSPTRPPDPASGGGNSNAAAPELRELCRTMGRLRAVRRLWTTASSYDAVARAACVRHLVEEKVVCLARTPGGTHGRRRCPPDGTAAAAPVILTQMTATAAEFRGFAGDVQRAVRAWDAEVAAPTPTSVSVTPGVLLPHPTDVHVLLRSLYFTKVIPSPRMQAALEAYAAVLAGLWEEHVSAVSVAPLVIDEAALDDVETRVGDTRRSASARLAAAWMDETVDLLHDLHETAAEGHTRVHLFTMFNDMVDVRVAQLLAAYDARRGVAEAV
ncbi:hypothetical protein NESM_000381100 [Novymonas esmeraldas]|uniref:Uncharacterized protein n=1 Tax=Novymonas esmeraldas TaxID=1808958 RepID=A0AAW0ELL6_9TRYP